MKPSMRAVQAIISLPVAGFFLTGCGMLGDSVRLRQTVLVKVPIGQPLAGCRSQGWEFRHVLQAPKTGGRQGEWYVAWNDDDPITSNRASAYWRAIFSRAPKIADAVRGGFGVYPLLIEPNLSFKTVPPKKQIKVEEGQRVPSKFGDGVRLVVGAPHMKVWPDGRQTDPDDARKFIIDPMWHFDAAHSEIAQAQQHFEHPGEGVRIGHLDNGLDARHPASPLKLERGDWQANVVGLLEYAQEAARQRARHEPVTAPKPVPPELAGGSHGMGTSGILAGGWVQMDKQEVPGGRVKSYDGWLGGAPYAHVVPVKIAPWVFSLGTGELAYGIDYASRVRGCDVITISHGGAPTQAWVDAVNAAYERGTAMFAAESDFFSLAFNPFQPRGFIVPASPVYPAAFRRVVGVTGVTSDRQSYARNSFARVLAHLGAWKQWAFRGSYGADGTNTSLLRPMSKPDTSESKRLGNLRAHPIAAYAPNVPWITLRKNGDKLVADGVDLDGSGTSAATPQVAAAAALWLQAHRAELVRAGWWSDWHKAEAVYHALLKSADRGDRHAADRYLGAGMLKADRALKVSVAEIASAPRPRTFKKGTHPPPESLYFGKAPNDYFDGGRSVWGLLGLQSGRNVPGGNRAKLRENLTPAPTQFLAMQRLYYNLLLLRDWHNGAVPVRDGRKKTLFTRSHDETRYWNLAARLAANSTPP